MKTYQIKKITAVKLFGALDFKTADKWTTNRLQSKLPNLTDLVDTSTIKNPKVLKILKKIAKADEVIVVTGDEPMAKKKKGKKKDQKKKAQKTETKKAAKKKASKRDGVKKVGVIASILEIIKNHGPITKPNIVKRLGKKFPDREPDGMTRTVNIQVPSRLNKEKKAKIKKDDKGRFFIK